MLSDNAASVGGSDLQPDLQNRVEALIKRFEARLSELQKRNRLPRSAMRPLLPGSILCGVIGAQVFVGYHPQLGLPTIIYQSLRSDRPDVEISSLDYYRLINSVYGVDACIVKLNLDWELQPDIDYILDKVCRSVATQELERSHEHMLGSTVKNDSIFGPNIYPIQNDLVFVLMPFSDPINEIYEGFIRPAIQSKGLVSRRADEIASNNAIMTDIWKSICEASLVVADMSTLNPNVMYELGLSHALGKETILLYDEGASTTFPFDLTHIRRINYRNTAMGGAQLKRELAETIESVRQKLELKAIKTS